MKTRNVCLKVLLCVLCLVLAVSCLFACGNDEQINDLNNKTDGITQDVNDLKTLVDEIKATADAAATATALKTAVEKSDASIKELKTELEKLAAADEELVKSIEAAATKAELKETVEKYAAEVEAKIAALNLKYDELGADVDAIKTQLEALGSDAVSAADLLAATDMLWNGEMSIANFDAIMAEVDEGSYPAEVYDEFYEVYEELRFFLTRAITVEAIAEYFDALEAYIDEMPDLVECISMFAEETEKVVLVDKDNARGASVKDGEDIASIIVLLDKAAAQNIVLSEDLAEKMDTILEAYNTIVDAQADSGNVVAYIDAIDYVIYDASKNAITDARNCFDDFEELWFANSEYAEYYDDNVAETCVENYDELVAAETRYAQLKDARSNKIAVIATALEFATDRPLYTDLAALEANKAEFAAWCAEYEIDVVDDAESINTIYYNNDKYEINLLNAAYDYAKAMDDIFDNIYVGTDETAMSVTTLIETITSYTEAPALYSDADAVDALLQNVADLKNAIADVDNYDVALDGNYVAMGMVGVEAALVALDTTIAGFEAAADKVQDVVDAMNAHKTVGIGYTDGDTIVGYKEALDEICEDYAIGTEGANYDAIAADAYALQAEIMAEYVALVQKVKDLYDAVTAEIAADWALKDGGKVAYFAGELRKFVIDLGIETIHIPLGDDPEATELNLKDLYDTFLNKATEYKNFALNAEADAVNVTALIAAIPDNYKDLKSYNAIKEAYEALVDWTENYLEVEEFSATANYKTMFEDIVGIAVYGETREYVFVSADDYEKAVEAYITNIAAFDAAAEEFAAIKAEMDALIATQGTDIHYWNNEIADTAVNFVDVAEKWADYVKTYYSNVVDDTTCVHNEFATVVDFEVAYGVCEQKYEFAVEDMGEIVDAINALATVTYANGETNADAILADIADIEALIVAYEATYCADDCLFGDSMVKLAQVKAAANFALECVAEYANTTQADKLQTIWDNTFEDITHATTEALVDKCYSTGISKLELLA